jgi:hypothetical protein
MAGAAEGKALAESKRRGSKRSSHEIWTRLLIEKSPGSVCKIQQQSSISSGPEWKQNPPKETTV